MSVILISHRLADVFAVADRVVLLQHRKICEDTRVDKTTLTEITQKNYSSLKN